MILNSHPIYFLIKQKIFWILGFGNGIKFYDNLSYIFLPLSGSWSIHFRKWGNKTTKEKGNNNRNSSNTKENKIFNILKPCFACKIHIRTSTEAIFINIENLERKKKRKKVHPANSYLNLVILFQSPK